MYAQESDYNQAPNEALEFEDEGIQMSKFKSAPARPYLVPPLATATADNKLFFKLEKEHCFTAKVLIKDKVKAHSTHQ